MRFAIRVFLFLVLLLLLGIVWLQCGLNPRKPAEVPEAQSPDEAISEYRQLLNNLN
jgi:hypothetical protein